MIEELQWAAGVIEGAGRSRYTQTMDGLHISLSSAEQAMVDEQIAIGGYASVDDYVGALVRADARRRAQAKLEALLLEGLEGEETEWTEADWIALRQRAEKH